MDHTPVGRDVRSGDVSQCVTPVPGSVLSADDNQFVSESQLGVELDRQKPVVGRPTRAEPTRVRRRTNGSVDARRLEVSRHADVEPQLIEDVWNASTDVAAERVADVAVDRLQRVPIRIA